jgi:hypothetical protein
MHTCVFRSGFVTKLRVRYPCDILQHAVCLRKGIIWTTKMEERTSGVGNHSLVRATERRFQCKMGTIRFKKLHALVIILVYDQGVVNILRKHISMLLTLFQMYENGKALKVHAGLRWMIPATVRLLYATVYSAYLQQQFVSGIISCIAAIAQPIE